MSTSNRKFKKSLHKKINDYFTATNNKKHFNKQMILKIIFGFLFWAITYAAILSVTSIQGVLIFYMLHGISHVFMGLNIGHDSSHNATFRNKTYNKVLSIISFDFIVGINSYRWHLAHNASHHPNINIHKLDPNLEVTSLLRFTPNRPLRKIHYYQHIYVSFLYLFLMLVWILYNDIKFFILHHDIGVFKKIVIPMREYVLLLLSKGFYFFYLFFIPIYFFDHHWLIVLFGFILLQFINGFLVAFVLQVSHIQKELSFPTEKPKRTDTVDLQHAVASTIDYGLDSPFFTWFFGGLNLHVIHHMYPHICHVHYAPLTRILGDTLKECGISYQEGIKPLQAYAFHLKSMKYFGRN